jgi:hypothetical protein
MVTQFLLTKEKLEFYRYDVGFVFQNFVLIENKTVRENLEMVNEKYRTPYSIKNVLERVDLLDKIDSKVYTLSGGEQQRIALARLFFKKSSIVLADEPRVEATATDYGQTLIHDHDRTFYNYGSEHQECLAHILRYLQSAIENEPKLTWHSKMKPLLQEIILAVKNESLDVSSKDKYIIEYEKNLPNKYYK